MAGRRRIAAIVICLVAELMGVAAAIWFVAAITASEYCLTVADV
jgi:hypothetical protein